MDFSSFFNQSGGFSQQQRGPEKKVDTQHYYDLLGVKKSDDARTIKRAFKKMALKHHPDRGGDPEKFKEISKAHEILSDPEKRKLYNKYGESLQGQGGSSLHDILNRRSAGKRKGQGGLLTVDVTLEDLYNGATKEGKFRKQFFCEGCGGKGGRNVRECDECNGRGTKVVIRHLGPSMIQQMQTNCEDCSGTGEIMKAKDRCRQCRGKKVYRKIHSFDVHVNPGMEHEQKIKFSEYGDQAPGIIPGDVFVQLKLAKHPKFSRKGMHLFYNHTLTLAEALTSFEFTIKTLDDRILIVQSEPNVLYEPGAIRAIREEGMPQEGDPSIRGNLYVVISVKFPESLDQRVIRELGTFLPTIDRPELKVDDSIEEVVLDDVDIEAEKEKWKHEKKERQDHDSMFVDDTEEQQGRTQTQECHTQ